MQYIVCTIFDGNTAAPVWNCGSIPAVPSISPGFAGGGGSILSSHSESESGSDDGDDDGDVDIALRKMKRKEKEPKKKENSIFLYLLLNYRHFNNLNKLCSKFSFSSTDPQLTHKLELYTAYSSEKIKKTYTALVFVLCSYISFQKQQVPSYYFSIRYRTIEYIENYHRIVSYMLPPLHS